MLEDRHRRIRTDGTLRGGRGGGARSPDRGARRSTGRYGGAPREPRAVGGDAAPGNIAELAECGVDVVAGTTGWYDRLEEVRRAVETAGIGLIYAPNFSLSTQVLYRVVKQAAELVDRLGGYDAYVLEAHHRHKRDRPSGTAARVAELLVSALSSKRGWSPGPPRDAIDPEVLEVTSVRAGELTGTHRVGFEGPHDRIIIEHEARDRSGFARGAVRAAEWIRGRRGTFTLEDMLSELWT